MSYLTLTAHPAAREDGWLSIVIANCIARDTEFVTKASDCTAALAMFAESKRAELTARVLASNHGLRGEVGVSFSAFICDGHGRKPNGYKKLNLKLFIPAQAAPVAAAESVEVAA